MTDREAMEKLWDAADDYLRASSNRTARITGDRLAKVLDEVRGHITRTTGPDMSCADF